MAAQVTDEVQKPVQTDFKLRSVLAPFYQYLKVPLNNISSGSVTIAPTSSQLLEFKLPCDKAYNTARSYIEWSESIPAQAAGVSNVTFEDVFDLGSDISFGAATGAELVKLQNAANYSKVARKIATSLDDFMDNSKLSGLYRCNTSAATNLVPGGYGTGPVLYSGIEEYIEPKHMKGDPAATASVRYRQYPLGAFVGTLLGTDRDFYAPVDQYLRIMTNPAEKMAFTTTDISGSPSAGPAATPAVITLNNIYLYLYVEQNPVINSLLMERYREGKLTYRIPFVQGFKNPGASGAGATTNISVQLPQNLGKRLKRMLHTVWNPQEKYNTAYDNSNTGGTKVQDYRTTLDSMDLQRSQVTCLDPAGTMVNAGDWAINKKFLEKRSCILSRESYQINWFHFDQMFEPHDKERSLPEVNLDEGISMDISHVWQFSCTNGTLGGGAVHYTWAEYSRDILITPQGAMFV